MSTYEFREYCRQRDSESYGDLLNQGFQVPKGQNFLEDFPIWSDPFSQSSKIKKFCIYLDHQIVASASIRIAELRLMESPRNSPLSTCSGLEDLNLSVRGVQVALLGAVVCHERHRGQGLATRVVLEALNWARQQRASFVFLWSAEHSFYQKLGFLPFGVQVRCSLRALLESQKRQSFQSHFQLQKGFNPGILAQIKERRGGLVNDLSLDHYYRAHTHVQWYSLGGVEQVSAFAAVGRGIDLDQHVHEWGGDSQQLIQLLGLIQRENPEAIFLSSVQGLDQLFPQWRSIGQGSQGVSPISTPILEPLCLAYPIEGTFLSRWGLRGQESDLDSHFVLRQRGATGESMTLDQSAFWFWGLDAS